MRKLHPSVPAAFFTTARAMAQKWDEEKLQSRDDRSDQNCSDQNLHNKPGFAIMLLLSESE
jgi:hypothetical protein